MSFDPAEVRAWLRAAVELARDLRTGEVLAAELAERCALAFGVAGESGPLSDRSHWLHALAREEAAAADPLSALVLVRIRHQSRTYWMAGDRGRTMTYAPHVTQRQAVQRFEGTTGRRHAELLVYREHHHPADAAALLSRLLLNA
jgi:hypothetical protein